MTEHENCISCFRPHNWTEDKEKSVGHKSFFHAVCEKCMDDLRNNKFDDDWSMRMLARFEERIKENNN